MEEIYRDKLNRTRVGRSRWEKSDEEHYDEKKTEANWIPTKTQGVHRNRHGRENK